MPELIAPTVPRRTPAGRRESVNFRLETDALEALRQEAARRGGGLRYTDLIREAVLAVFGPPREEAAREH